jgi:ribosome maturation factor RimP
VADLESELRSFVEGLGYEFVELKQAPSRNRLLLRLFVDVGGDEPGAAVSHGDCIRVTRELADFIEAEGLVRGAFVLEVSSPGIGRPLTTERHFRRSVGRLVEIRGRDAAGRNYELSGRIGEAVGGKVWVQISETETRLVDLAEVILAKLVPDFRRPGRPDSGKLRA